MVDGLTNPEPIRDKIDLKISQLMDLNQRITSILRIQAKDFEALGGTYQAMSSRCYEITDHIAQLAAIAASNTGDIIIAEFGLEEEDDDDNDEEKNDD